LIFGFHGKPSGILKNRCQRKYNHRSEFLSCYKQSTVYDELFVK